MSELELRVVKLEAEVQRLNALVRAIAEGGVKGLEDFEEAERKEAEERERHGDRCREEGFTNGVWLYCSREAGHTGPCLCEREG